MVSRGRSVVWWRGGPGLSACGRRSSSATVRFPWRRPTIPASGRWNTAGEGWTGSWGSSGRRGAEGREPRLTGAPSGSGPPTRGSGAQAWRAPGAEREGEGPSAARAPVHGAGGGGVPQATSAWSPSEGCGRGGGAGPTGRTGAVAPREPARPTYTRLVYGSASRLAERLGRDGPVALQRAKLLTGLSG